MEKIVKQPLKIDFHIHSHSSNHKDKDIVRDGTIDNLPILISKLVENEVNMVSITDHDNFDYEMYKKLKEEEKKDNCIKKVLPGIEFSVKIENEILHIIALFNDDKDSNLESIQSEIFNKVDNRPLYDLENSFSEEKFISILRKIGLDTILIAHQKESLGSSKPRKHDANTVSVNAFDNFIFIDYFEAYEFKNKRNEIFNKYYIENQKPKLKDMQFITGSDCHSWSNYPEKAEDGEFEFSYFKCLPTFRGVMMAITDLRRIKIGVSSFFSANAPIDKIELNINGFKNEIELSKGINAIIGDNSIGKSLLLHKLTEYREISSDKKLITAYDNYLKENKIDVITKIPQKDIRHFDKQGNIRNIFTNNKTKSKDFIKEYYPIEPNYDLEKQKLEKKVDEFINFLKRKEKIELEKSKLGNIQFELHEEISMSLQVIPIDLDLKASEVEYKELILKISKLIESNNELLTNKLLTKDEIEKVKKYSCFLEELKIKYQEIIDKIKIEEAKVIIINNKITEFNTELENTKTEEQKQRESYNLKFVQLSRTICNLINLNEKELKFSAEIDEIKLEPEINKNGEYRFICKSDIIKIDSNYLYELLTAPLLANFKKSINNLSLVVPKEFKEGIKTGETIPEDIFEYYKLKIIEKIDKDLKIRNCINNTKDSDVTKELSSGANAQIYFDLLSNDIKNPGVYIIDQPEDDVSQPSIKKKLLKDFKKISNQRQVILITHNPQFIINLDVDNVIFIKRDEQTEKISIENGALEYKDDNTDMLKIIADNIEGGIDSLKERYKKYEKNN